MVGKPQTGNISAAYAKLILYFRMVAHKAACHTLSMAFLEINEDMVQILLMLEELFTQDSKVEDLFYCSFRL